MKATCAVVSLGGVANAFLAWNVFAAYVLKVTTGRY